MGMPDPSPILLTGASGYVGRHLATALTDAGHRMRGLTRNPDPGRLPDGVEPVQGDAISGDGLPGALDGVRTAYYLIHSMEGGDFAARDRQAAVNFGEAAAAAGVQRVLYLGGLGHGDSEHLRSREEVGKLLAERVPTVHVRAAMIIGPGSASFEMLRHLVRRLPVMLAPRWVDTPSQPVSIGDVTAALVALSEREEVPAEVELGGADVLTYREMMTRAAALMSRRPVIVGVPVLTPRLSSYWVSLFTPVSAGLVRPLIEGMGTEMVVEHPPPAGINDDPLGFEAAVKAALA